MTANLQAYKAHLQAPWGKLQYDIVFAFLESLRGQKILDFGSGFGIVADFLAKNNQVTAIELSPEMIAERKQNFYYEQLQGSLDLLQQLPDQSFDVIICHNVLEYVSDPALYLAEFSRLLKKGGKISLVKHHEVGRIMHTVVFENDPEKAQHLLAGETYQTHSMGSAKVYQIQDVISGLPLEVEDYQGIRIFYGLQANDYKTAPDWAEKMFEMELAVCNQSPYRDIAAFQHLWLSKH